MKSNTSKFTVVQKTTARKNVVDAHQELDAQSKSNQEEYARKVAFKAYELFERRGYQHGNDIADWLQAERLVREGL